MGLAQRFIRWVPHNTSSVMGKLKLDLYAFPSYIGHSSSRINRLHNEDAYSISMMKLMNSNLELQMSSHSNQATLSSTDDKNEDIFTKPVLNINVFDGHGGKKTSQWLSGNLSQELARTVPNKEAFYGILKQYHEKFPESKYWENIYTKREKYYHRFIINCFTKREQILFNNGSRMIFDKSGNIIDKTSLLTELDRLRIFQCFLDMDINKVIKNEEEENGNSGSTVSSILLSPYNEDETLPVSNRDVFFTNSENLLKLCVVQVGDCKVLLCDKEGKAHQLTMLHHPNNLQETKRLKVSSVENSKTSVESATDYTDESVSTDSFGEQRFLNMYANTRSFGDLQGKAMGLSCEPDIYSYLIGNTKNLPQEEKSKLQFGGDECFVCLVSDGVTDALSDQEIVDIITTCVNNRGLKKATPQFACDEVINFLAAIAKKNADNATCLVLKLSNWGNWPVLDRTGRIREEKLMKQDDPRD